MDAMILSAGLGTRLRPLTDDTPKALITVNNVPIIEQIARRLVLAGADRLIVNVHHHGDQIERFLREIEGLQAEILISPEPERPLGTGGGLAAAEPLFRRVKPFFLHVGDVITDFDLREMYEAHSTVEALATLAVNRRDTARYLLFDAEGLYGWANEKKGATKTSRSPVGETSRLPFAGVHVISPELFGLITEEDVFSIIDVYLRLAAEGHRIIPHDVSDALWLEIGTPHRLERAREVLADLRDRSDSSPQ